MSQNRVSEAKRIIESADNCIRDFETLKDDRSDAAIKYWTEKKQDAQKILDNPDQKTESEISLENHFKMMTREMKKLERCEICGNAGTEDGKKCMECFV